MALIDALDQGLPDETVLPLITADAATTEDRDGWLPLHVAAQNAASIAVFAALIEAFPGGVARKNDDGDLALHIAAANEACDAALLALIDASPETLQEADAGGELPLHTAAYNRASQSVLQRMVDVHQPALRHEDNYANLPLHVACENAAAPGVIRTLVDAHPVRAAPGSAACAVGGHGRMFGCACECGCGAFTRGVARSGRGYGVCNDGRGDCASVWLASTLSREIARAISQPASPHRTRL